MNSEQSLAEAMKQGMRRLASGVGVVTARTETQRLAMTASSITSVSDQPASLLVCVNRATSLCAALQVGSAFGVNILGREQQQISNICAGAEQGEARFQTGHWYDNNAGIPLLADSQVSFSCVVDQCHPYGTHHIVIGRIEAVELGGEVIDPLIYLDGGYR
ncbi:MAG: flavin reductase family protein [Cellvibrionaceae bacterium]|nr:flavin reductase family protein [Cellvibrionaceae bacterium]MCV6625163.1 flavin reductase family protein [Cellvibrionaceae bacterium]